MHLFRLRLIFALILGVTLVSVASTYFEVLAHKHTLRGELERRTRWMGTSLEPDVVARSRRGIRRAPRIDEDLKAATRPWGWLCTTRRANSWLLRDRSMSCRSFRTERMEKSLQKAPNGRVRTCGDTQWLEEALPLHQGDKLEGSLVVLVDAGTFAREGYAVWQRSFWRIAGPGGADRGGDAADGALVPDGAR